MFAAQAPLRAPVTLPACRVRTSSRGASLRAAALPRRCVTRATAVPAESPAALQPAITLTAASLEQLKKLKAEHTGKDMVLRVGVKSGGCSGMSYVMDFTERSSIDASDAVIDHPDGFQIVCDPKSLLYLFGMELDYSTQLIGGGFQFHNPNAEKTCGCGKSFNT